MPGGKGPSRQGTIQQQIENPVVTAQLPHLESGWNAADELYRQPYSYYPGQTLATPNYWQPTGFNSLAAAGATANNAGTQGADALNYGIGGGYGVGNSPAASGFSNIAYGGNPFLTQSGSFISGLSGVGNQAAANPYAGLLESIAAEAGGPNAAIDALTKTSSGAYLNSNPYLDSMFGSASDAVTRAYQTATAPQTASNFSGAGRYGSGAYANSASQNEQNLGSSLGNLSANIYGGNYQAERARQDAASGALGALIAQMTGLRGNITDAAGKQYLGGLDLAGRSMAQGGALDMQALTAQQQALNAMQGGYQTGNAQQLAAIGMLPQALQSMFLGPEAQIRAGQGLTGMEQQVLSDQEKRFYGQQQAPWDALTKYMAAIGQPMAGSNTTTSPLLGPNPLSSGISTASSLAGLGGQLGLGSAMGKGASSAVPAMLTGASTGALGSTVGATAAAAAPAMWIVCTELTRQKRMPKRHWAAGIAVFAAYPERTKNGYYCWAIPTVRHLRAHPDSRFSRFIGAISRWRAENIAAKRGVRGAKWRLRGAMVTAIGYPLCAALGHFAQSQDWSQVYDKSAPAS